MFEWVSSVKPSKAFQQHCESLLKDKSRKHNTYTHSHTHRHHNSCITCWGCVFCQTEVCIHQQNDWYLKHKCSCGKNCMYLSRAGTHIIYGNTDFSCSSHVVALWLANLLPCTLSGLVMRKGRWLTEMCANFSTSRLRRSTFFSLSFSALLKHIFHVLQLFSSHRHFSTVWKYRGSPQSSSNLWYFNEGIIFSRMLNLLFRTWLTEPCNSLLWCLSCLYSFTLSVPAVSK